MSFKDMMTDKIKVIKQDGKEYDKLPAAFSKGKFTTFKSSIPITEGDVIERALPNGIIERYIVEQAEFSNGMPPDISAFWSLNVKKSGVPEKPHAIKTINIHTRDNSKINIDSVDNSITNNLTNNNDLAAFDAIKELLVGNQIALDNLAEVVSAIQQNDKPKLFAGWTNFLGAIASVATIAESKYMPIITHAVGKILGGI